MDGGPTLETTPASIRKSYLEAFDAYRKRIRALCDRCACHYVLCNTSVPLDETLSEYLAFRQGHRTR